MENKKSLSTQLGYYIGEYIVGRFLPTLSCDMIQSFHVLKITDEEQTEYDRLDELWYNKRFIKPINEGDEHSKEEWENLKSFRKKLKEKYLPEILECYLPILEKDNIDIDLFKKAVGVALWDCDFSYYRCEPDNIEIIFATEKYDFPKIILRRE